MTTHRFNMSELRENASEADRPTSTASTDRRVWVFAIVVAAMALLVGIVHALDVQIWGRALKLDATFLAIVIVGVLPLVALLFPRLFDRVKSINGLGLKLELLEKDVARQQRAIDEQQKILNRLTVFSMEGDIFDTLENLDNQPNFTFNKNFPLLVRQFQFLFDRDLINRPPDDLNEGEEVGSGKLVTPLGKDYIKIRRVMHLAEQARLASS